MKRVSLRWTIVSSRRNRRWDTCPGYSSNIWLDRGRKHMRIHTGTQKTTSFLFFFAFTYNNLHDNNRALVGGREGRSINKLGWFQANFSMSWSLAANDQDMLKLAKPGQRLNARLMISLTFKRFISEHVFIAAHYRKSDNDDNHLLPPCRKSLVPVLVILAFPVCCEIGFPPLLWLWFKSNINHHNPILERNRHCGTPPPSQHEQQEAWEILKCQRRLL